MDDCVALGIKVVKVLPHLERVDAPLVIRNFIRQLTPLSPNPRYCLQYLVGNGLLKGFRRRCDKS